MNSLVDRFALREDLHQSLGYAAVMESIGWVSIPHLGSRIVVRPLGPIGIAKIQRPKVLDLPWILSLRSKLHLLHVVIELSAVGSILTKDGKTIDYTFFDVESGNRALDVLSLHGFRVTSEHYAHSKTALLDLVAGREAIYGAFPQKTRYNIRLASRKDVVYSSTPFAEVSESMLQEALQLHASWSREKNIFGYSDHFLRIVLQSFPVTGRLLRAVDKSTLVGVFFLIVHDRVGQYYYTCTSKEGRKKHVPSGMTAYAIDETLKLGGDIFDFCSVFDERYPQDHPRWKGFSTFKERFSPTPFYYPPTVGRWFW